MPKPVLVPRPVVASETRLEMDGSATSGARRLEALAPKVAPMDVVDDVQASAVREIVPGAVIAGTRYRVVRKLGDGGMGTVYEAEHVDIERRVALKILHHEFTRTPLIVEQFRREARAASKVGSEHIAQVFDFAELADGSVMFTMELVHGPTLRAELRHGPLPQARAIGLLRQICKGLDAAHKAGVVHRDVKPDNIVITTRAGRSDAVKLLDFGIAAMMGEDLRPMSAGTPHYLAPELVAGATFDRRADVYAVGCTAYEMLVGRPPFGALGDDPEQVLGNHLADVAEAPSRARPGVSKALDAVIMRCLAKLPSNRFRNMGELEAALCAAQIDAALQTSWDDLPVPDGVDPELRERLLREMPDMHGPVARARGWLGPLAFVGVLAAAAAAGWFYVLRTPPIVDAPAVAAAAPSAADTLAEAARAAAARGAWVYPIDPADSTTAFANVRALEALGDPQAVAIANELRRELASTLERLGDSYWDREGGRTFAVEHYRQALVFDGTRARAAERAALDAAALADLSHKAEAVAFTATEIAAVGRMRSASVALRGRGGDPTAPLSGVPEVPPDAALAGGEPLPPVPPQAGAAEQAGALDLVKSAKQLLRAGQRADAEVMFKRALAYDPNNGDALRSMFAIETARGDHTSALEYAELLVANAPGRADHHVLAGDAAFALREYDDARRSWSRAAALGAKSANGKLAKLEAIAPAPKPAVPPEPAAPSEATNTEASDANAPSADHDDGSNAPPPQTPAKDEPRAAADPVPASAPAN